MGQKVNPISVRLEQTNRHFDSCWYGDYQYSYLLNKDLKVKSYINKILKQIGCPEGHISVIFMAKKIKILFCYLDPRRSTYLKSSRFYIKVANKNSNKFKIKQRKRYFFKNKLVARYLLRKNKTTITSREMKYDRKIPFVMKKKAISRLTQAGNIMEKNLAFCDIGCNVKTYSQKGLKKPLQNYSLNKKGGKWSSAKKSFTSDMNTINGGFAYYGKKKIKLGASTEMPTYSLLKRKDRNSNFSISNKVGGRIVSTIPKKINGSWKEDGLRRIIYKKKSLESDEAMWLTAPVPFSSLLTRKNPFRLLLAFYKKKKRKKKIKKKRFPATMVSRTRFNTGRASPPFVDSSFASLARRRLLKKRKGVYPYHEKSGWRQVAFWRYLTNLSTSIIGREKKRNYDVFSATWSYLFFNHKNFLNKVIQKKRGFQTWHKSLFIRYLLLFILKKRFKFCASPLNSFIGNQIFQLAKQRRKKSNFQIFSETDAEKRINVKKLKKRGVNRPSFSAKRPSLKSQILYSSNVRKIGLNVEVDRIIAANKNINSGLLKYQMVLESINKIEWFQGRGIAFLWFLFNSVHPSRKTFKTGLALANTNKKLFFRESKEGLQPWFACSQKRKNNLKLYIYPHQITPSQTIVVNKIKNFQVSNKTKLGQKRKHNLPSSILTENGNFFKLSALPLKKKSSEKRKIPLLRLPINQIPFSYKKDGKNKEKTKTFNHLLEKQVDASGEGSLAFRSSLCLPAKQSKTHPFVCVPSKIKIPRKPLYPRTVKSKGFLSYVEYFLSSHLKSNVRLILWKTKDEKRSALFIVEQIVYFLEKRVPFSRIKQQICRELKLGLMQGIRITYSGRLGGRSKKAQRSRQKTFQWGQTSSHVFASKLSFAYKHALTIFGKIGIKVWVCYK